MEFLQSVLAFIVTLGILVTFHEYGHFWVARRCGVKVHRFSFGFGKPLVSWYDRHGTEFAIAAFPLGGYVKMLDEKEGPVPSDQLQYAFNRKPVIQRIAIILAGPLANFLLAVVAFWIMLMLGFQSLVPVTGKIADKSLAQLAGIESGYEVISVNNEPTPTWYDFNIELLRYIGDTTELNVQLKQHEVSGTQSSANITKTIPITDWLSGQEQPNPVLSLGITPYAQPIPAVVDQLVAGGRAEKTGLQSGDKILAVNDQKINDWRELVEQIKNNPEKNIALHVLRKGETQIINLRPAFKQQGGKKIGFAGISAQSVNTSTSLIRTVKYSPVKAFFGALDKTWSMITLTVTSIKKMVLGDVSVKNLSGPITIAKVASNSAKLGLESFLNFLALVSISLGVINLLPVPVLDGGHLLFYFVEWVKGSPVSEKAQVIGLQIGLSLVIAMMFLAFYNDLSRL
ncbi:RIP metalloprotease RseP [Endozoicomonas sp. SM1973]|uniref:Zinc metalloprotease n=1 Tax=Spartinivicinus marinus TaxID=2994442 RepID=A0A853I5A4_9GAMM|nr:RIP metalloprotease RseP [Spartinivicinus marinus]MCX4025447.1 RIP metalloprotease RseP [Spartinivicinus marinus]NYZ65324.1 RIP metalloprotease RseP [Spartinivicinus marinus]